MKILWLSNVIFPEACKELNIQPPAVGGWMHASASALLESDPSIQLTVVSMYTGSALKCINKYAICYYLVPNPTGIQTYNQDLEKYFKQIQEECNPDLVHIHGSEYPHSLAFIKGCKQQNVVVSIQGLVGSYADYYLGGIPESTIKKCITIRDVIRKDSLLIQQKNMRQRGMYERELIKSVKHIIGRTSWDKAHCWEMNPDIHYHFCNETLRPSFYSSQWKYETCRTHSIFLSQAHYPIKGIQQVIKALPIILKHYPDTQVYVAGNNFIKTSFLKRNGFSDYLQKIMTHYQVKDKITFLGILNEEQMTKQYVEANVFICPSSIENSPNSVGEAQLIGTPCVASYVGGTMDMIEEGKTGLLYRFEETTILAQRVCQIFADDTLAKALSREERIVASCRHNKEFNAKQLYSIYKSILK